MFIFVYICVHFAEATFMLLLALVFLAVVTVGVDARWCPAGTPTANASEFVAESGTSTSAFFGDAFRGSGSGGDPVSVVAVVIALSEADFENNDEFDFDNIDEKKDVVYNEWAVFWAAYVASSTKLPYKKI